MDVGGTLYMLKIKKLHGLREQNHPLGHLLHHLVMEIFDCRIM